jgi:hypothetical protein
MFRLTLLVLILTGGVSACTDTSLAQVTPHQFAMDPALSDSVGFTGVAQEPY